ncbi:hypothetical protein AB5I41_08090 [Sphingomonas sp. MMS24-JH45]
MSFRPGSPSNGTSTVSPSSVPENFERIDPTTQPFSLSLGTLWRRAGTSERRPERRSGRPPCPPATAPATCD